MYLFFMSVITYEHMKRVTKKNLLFLAIFVLAFGGILELLQLAITETRIGSFVDFMANAIGITLSLLATFFIKPIKKRIF